jgi:hypothetical protein
MSEAEISTAPLYGAYRCSNIFDLNKQRDCAQVATPIITQQIRCRANLEPFLEKQTERWSENIGQCVVGKASR